MSRSDELMHDIERTEERIAEREEELLRSYDELEEALANEGRQDEWLNHWKGYRDCLYEKVYGESPEDEEIE